VPIPAPELPPPAHALVRAPGQLEATTRGHPDLPGAMAILSEEKMSYFSVRRVSGTVCGHPLDAGPAPPAALLQDRQEPLGDR
jgi:hypothetical protein